MRDILSLTRGQPLAGQIVPDEFVTRLPRYKAQMSLALKGQRFALFKTQYVLSCNSNYLGYIIHQIERVRH
ncbi:hypothetical protein EFS38_18955 [Dickeya undicola]|uniref:Uncharacterized protein n=1 Tax=Dickeya undicola TaxID=1577887 RepID=A0ABX9WRF1_9GAMM|nr:hypothetical protein EFS38_18955 [Dickeya undicola]